MRKHPVTNRRHRCRYPAIFNACWHLTFLSPFFDPSVDRRVARVPTPPVGDRFSRTRVVPTMTPISDARRFCEEVYASHAVGSY